MAASVEAVCNLALVRIGAATISSISASTVEAQACNAIYSSVKNTLLNDHPWKFGKTRATLTVDGTAPDWGWSYRYALPATCLRVLEMEGQDTYEWTVEKGYLFNNVGGDIGITYIPNDLAVTAFSASFDEALAAELAYQLSFSLVQSVSLREELRKEAVKKLREARSFNAQQGAGERFYADTWLNSRA